MWEKATYCLNENVVMKKTEKQHVGAHVGVKRLQATGCDIGICTVHTGSCNTAIQETSSKTITMIPLFAKQKITWMQSCTQSSWNMNHLSLRAFENVDTVDVEVTSEKRFQPMLFMDQTRGATSSSFRGGAIFMNFHLMTSSCLFNRGTTFSRICSDMFFSQHFRKWKRVSLNQAHN